MTQFFVGTAGWSYLRWDKEFYPEGTAAGDKLAYYAKHFNAVELNNSFYHTPEPKQFTAWEKDVPAHFRFAVKASRYITHIKKLKDAEETVPPFLKAAKGQKKAGPIFFQLPPSFPRNLERLCQFLETLPPERRYAIELRDPSWHEKEVYAALKKHKVAFCLYDTPEGVSPRISTTDFSYVRLRGRNGKKIDTFLREWKAWLSNNTIKALVFFDNREEKRLAFGNALIFRAMTRSNAK